MKLRQRLSSDSHCLTQLNWGAIMNETTLKHTIFRQCIFFLFAPFNLLVSMVNDIQGDCRSP